MADELMTVEVERDIRIAIWNAAMKGGMGQSLSQALIVHAMEEPCMARALSTISSALHGRGSWWLPWSRSRSSLTMPKPLRLAIR